MGIIGGFIWQGIAGLVTGPKKEKLKNALYRVTTRAPRFGSGFALFSVLFSATDCTLSHFRGIEDWKNSVTAGAVSGGILAMRNGVKTTIFSAITGGLFLLLIEGAMHFTMKLNARNQQMILPPDAAPKPVTPVPASKDFEKEFEKDNDQNYHIDFIHSIANCRASNYKLEPMDWMNVKARTPKGRSLK